jgi:hypothetical protein
MTINSSGHQNTLNPYYNADKRQNLAENRQEQDVNKVIEKRNEELQKEASSAKNDISQTLNSYSAEQLSKVHDTSKISMNVLDISI